MSNEKFTPGPWHAGKKDNPIGYFPIYGRTGVTKISCIAKTDAHEVGFGISEIEHKANAALIAAAPEMYEALKFHCMNCNHQTECEGCPYHKVLKKARGQA